MSERRAHCESTIANVKGMLSVLEEERMAIDTAMTELIKRTTNDVGQELTRSNSQKNLEDLISPRQGFARTGSSCNLEEMAVESLSSNAKFKSDVF